MSPNTLMLQALLFDLDGTLANTDPVHFQTWKDTLIPFGLDIDREFYDRHFSGRLNAAIVAHLLPQLSPEAGTALSAQKEAEFRRRAAGELQPLAGLMPVLQWANSRQLKQAVVTNAPVANAEFMLQVLGLDRHFQTVVIAEHLERGKPDPLPYQVALERLGIAAQSAVAFEDSPSGVRSAVGAGVLTVGIASTHAPEELSAVGAKLVVPDFAAPELDELLQFSFQQAIAQNGCSA